MKEARLEGAEVNDVTSKLGVPLGRVLAMLQGGQMHQRGATVHYVAGRADAPKGKTVPFFFIPFSCLLQV